MPTNIDILLERLKQFDEVTLLELLDISAEDIIDRFKDRIILKKKFLYGEIEILNIDDEELEEEDALDGFQIEYVEEELEEEDEDENNNKDDEDE